MSYCRFSSDNWASDVYVYEDVSGGWTTHVASRRRTWPIIPDIPITWAPSFGGEWSIPKRRTIYPSRLHAFGAKIVFGAWVLWHRLHMWSVGISPLKTIGLPHDGEGFNDETPGECAARLQELRKLGYHVPQYAIDALLEEASEVAA